MKQFTDLLKYGEVKEVKTTNYVVDTIETLEDMLFIVKSLTNYKKSLILYSLLKLNFVWGSQYENLDISKHYAYSFMKHLRMRGFIETRQIEECEQRYLFEKHKIHPKDISKFEGYCLSDKGRDFLENREILESLKIIIVDKLSYFNTELNNRIKYFEDNYK